MLHAATSGVWPPKMPARARACVPAVVPEADDGAGRDQLIHRVRIAVVRGVVQCGVVVAAATAPLGAPLRTCSTDGTARAWAGPESGGGARGSLVGVLRVEIGALLDEERDLVTALNRRAHQRRIPIPVQRHIGHGGRAGHTALDGAAWAGEANETKAVRVARVGAAPNEKG
jgi:hypothetical protein